MLPFISIPFEYLSGKLGASPDELKLIFSFLVSYPLAGLLKRVPDAKPVQKNLFIIATAIFYLVGLFDLWDGLQTIAISSAGTYALAYFLRKSPFMPWIGFVFLMGHLSMNQLKRQFANSPSTIDVTGAQMVLVMKLSAFCWNVADGQLPENELADPHQKDRRLPEIPSLLDFAGYVLFFPALMAGPAFDFAEYRRWLDTTMFDLPAQVDPAKKPPVRKKRKIPRSGTPAALKAASGLVWIGLFVQLGGLFPWPVLLDTSYLSYGLLRRIFILHMVSFAARCKYYGVWSLTEGACILTGLGYNGIDPTTGKVSWNRLQNIEPLGVEFAQNPRAYLASWNMNTNNWLRNYVYLRVTPKGKKPGFRASLITFTTSAFWHGFYPGYYLSFVLASLIQTVAKNFRRHLRPFFLDPTTGKPTPKKVYYDIFSYLATQLAFTFTTAPFLILGFQDSITVWARVYFYAVVGTLASMAFFASPGKAFLKKKLEIRNAGAGGKLVRTTSADDIRGPVMGLSADPEKDLAEAVEEIRADLAARQKQKEL